jgi:hypothetical protein
VVSGPGAGAALFAVCLVHSWANSATHVLYPHEQIYSSGFSLLTRRPTGLGLAVTLLGTPLFIYACWAFFSAPHPLVWAGLLLGMMAGVRQLERRVWHDDIVVKLGKYVPAAAALLGHSVARGALLLLDRPPAEAEAAGWEAACGVLGGAFFLAGLAKLRESGFDWVRARHQALLIAERAYSGAPALRWLRRRVAATPWLCLAAGLYGFYGEFLGLLFAFSWARWPVAVFSVALQIGITVLLGYVELEWLLILIALALLSGA